MHFRDESAHRTTALVRGKLMGIPADAHVHSLDDSLCGAALRLPSQSNGCVRMASYIRYSLLGQMFGQMLSLWYHAIAWLCAYVHQGAALAGVYKDPRCKRKDPLQRTPTDLMNTVSGSYPFNPAASTPLQPHSAQCFYFFPSDVLASVTRPAMPLRQQPPRCFQA
jgi:hypothetical protein